MATYASTGAAGVDVEMEYAALLAVRLIAESGDPALPQRALPHRLSLQRRDGPKGFDDVVVEWRRDGGEGVTFVQSKRAFSVGDNADFCALARALAEFHDARDWTAAIVTGSLSPAVGDVQDILESARLSTSKAEFDIKWAATGVLNDAKRQVLKGFTEATKGLAADAAWNAMRRLRLIEHDFALPQSRDRQSAINLLRDQAVDPSTAETGFAELRSVLLAAGQLAPTFDRAMLLERAPSLAVRPIARLRQTIDQILAESSRAVLAISDRLEGTECAITLLRPDSWTTLVETIRKSNIVRLTGDAGCGKSCLLKRYAATFEGSALVLNERRIVAQSWSEAAIGWGAPVTSAEELVSMLASSGACLLAIDGADRMLLDHRRAFVLELFGAIAVSPLRERWSIVTSGRDFGQRDLIRDALRQAGLEAGERITVGPLDDADAAVLVKAFPNAKTLLSRSDLANLNRNPFMVQQLLASDDQTVTLTEIALADAWATRGVRTSPVTPERDTVVAQLAAARVGAPTVVPSLAHLDPGGVTKLIDEGAAIRLSLRDGIVFAHDVFEDWALARELQRDWRRIAERLRAAEEPLWWQRAVRLAAQMLLETGCDQEWHSLLCSLEQHNLDAAWGRLVLVAPLHSENAAVLLPRIQPILLADDAQLLGRLLESLRVVETRIQEGLLDSPLFAGMSEAERFSLIAQFKTPVWRPWLAFMRWSLPQWQTCPDALLPSLVELAEIWTWATEYTPNGISAEIASHVSKWLAKVEDYQHSNGSYRSYSEREEPFALNCHYNFWDKFENTLRRILAMTTASAPQLVEGYLERVTAQRRLQDAREWLLEHPHQLPAKLPGAWTAMMRAVLLQRRRQFRDSQLGPSSCFDSPMAFDAAGINDDHSFYPSSPLQAGWNQLFEHDTDSALAMMHRLEMRVAVFWRNYTKRRDRRCPRPLVLHLPSRTIQLWGDENVYRWSRAILGPNALASAYLAFDNWLEKQLADGVQLADLLPRILQNNGLVATTAPIINAAAQRQSDHPTVSAIAPFLGAPRLWCYDIRRHLDDRSPTHRMGGVMGRHRQHIAATEAVWQRYRRRQPLHHQLLAPFHLFADQDAKALLEERRVGWRLEDLADYDDELADNAWRAEHEETLERFRSDADPESIRIQESAEPNRFLVAIAPPEHHTAAVEAINREQSRAAALSNLAIWAERSLKEGVIGEGHTLATAIETLAALEGPEDVQSVDMTGRFARAASAGVAAVIARFADVATVEGNADWLRERLWAAVTRERNQQESMFLVPQTVLTLDPQMLGACGLAALVSRGLMPEFERAVADLATSDLHAVAVSTLRGLDWQNAPDFAWRCAVAALDMCVFDITGEWLSERQKARRRLANMRRRQDAVAHVINRDKTRPPLLPPHPYCNQWCWSWRVLPPLRRVRVRAVQGLDWGRVKTLLESLKFEDLDQTAQTQLRDYLVGLTEWAKNHRETDERRYGYHDRFPHDLANTLAHQLGRLAAITGDGQSWQHINALDYHHREGDLVSRYLDVVIRDLVDSGRAPDDRFWSAWRPAADWAMTLPLSMRRDDDWDYLGHALEAAGFVGPYMTPLPPDWPHLALLLPTIDSWVAKTASHPRAAKAMLAIGERMSVEQRERWLLQWLENYVALHGRDARFWMYDELADGAAGLLSSLDNRPETVRRRVRQLLSIFADAGSLAARELLPRFASGRQT